jgi:hypothetical protein
VNKGSSVLPRLGVQAEALQGGLNAWRSAYPVEPTSDTAA